MVIIKAIEGSSEKVNKIYILKETVMALYKFKSQKLLVIADWQVLGACLSQCHETGM